MSITTDLKNEWSYTSTPPIYFQVSFNYTHFCKRKIKSHIWLWNKVSNTIKEFVDSLSFEFKTKHFGKRGKFSVTVNYWLLIAQCKGTMLTHHHLQMFHVPLLPVLVQLVSHARWFLLLLLLPEMAKCYSLPINKPQITEMAMFSWLMHLTNLSDGKRHVLSSSGLFQSSSKWQGKKHKMKHDTPTA